MIVRPPMLNHLCLACWDESAPRLGPSDGGPLDEIAGDAAGPPVADLGGAAVGAKEKGTVTITDSVGRLSGIWTLPGPTRMVGVWSAQRTPPLYVPSTASPAPNPVASRT